MWLMYKYLCAVYKGLIVQHYPGSCAVTNQISLSAASATDKECLEWRAKNKEKQKQCRYFSTRSYIFGCEYFSINARGPLWRRKQFKYFSHTSCGAFFAGFCSLCWEMGGKKCTFPNVEIDCRWTVTGQWRIWTRLFMVKTVKYIFLLSIFFNEFLKYHTQLVTH